MMTALVRPGYVPHGSRYGWHVPAPSGGQGRFNGRGGVDVPQAGSILLAVTVGAVTTSQFHGVTAR